MSGRPSFQSNRRMSMRCCCGVRERSDLNASFEAQASLGLLLVPRLLPVARHSLTPVSYRPLAGSYGVSRLLRSSQSSGLLPPRAFQPGASFFIPHSSLSLSLFTLTLTVTVTLHSHSHCHCHFLSLTLNSFPASAVGYSSQAPAWCGLAAPAFPYAGFRSRPATPGRARP